MVHWSKSVRCAKFIIFANLAGLQQKELPGCLGPYVTFWMSFIDEAMRVIYSVVPSESRGFALGGGAAPSPHNPSAMTSALLCQCAAPATTNSLTVTDHIAKPKIACPRRPRRSLSVCVLQTSFHCPLAGGGAYFCCVQHVHPLLLFSFSFVGGFLRFGLL